jgi:putative tryptophan/tyrosine transport system substrate-binding protein
VGVTPSRFVRAANGGRGSAQPRRAFLWGAAGLLCLAACSRPATPRREQRKVARVGYLAAGVPGGSNSTAFVQGLADLGWVEGQNLTIHYRWGSGNDDEFHPLVAELLALDVDVIQATGLPAVRAAMQATTTTPIVMTSIGDPVQNGLVERLGRPGGNATGISIMAPQLSAKRLELLKEAVPSLARVGVLYNPSTPDMVLSWNETEQAAPQLGVEALALSLTTAEEIGAALGAASAQRADALILLSDDVVFRSRRQILERATAAGLPTMGSHRAYAETGGLLAYGPNYGELFRRAAAQVDKILNGTPPAVLPVEQPTKFELVINRKAAQALGVTLPLSILLEAAEVIE